MRHGTLLKASILGLAVSLSAGCAVNETATVTTGPDGTIQTIESNSGLLAASLKVTDTKVGSAGNLMKVQATITNDSRSALSFQYKFKWLDKDGFEIAIDGRPWTPLTITPHESKAVQAVAPNPGAKAFKILVQD